MAESLDLRGNSMELSFLFNKLYTNGSITKEEYSKIINKLLKGS